MHNVVDTMFVLYANNDRSRLLTRETYHRAYNNNNNNYNITHVGEKTKLATRHYSRTKYNII